MILPRANRAWLPGLLLFLSGQGAVFALVSGGDGKPYPEWKARHQAALEAFEASVATPIYYWFVLGIALIAANCRLFRHTRNCSWRRSAALHLIPIVSFMLLILYYFKLREFHLLVWLDFTAYDSMSPPTILQLGSTARGALALVGLWLALHPILWLKDPTENARRKIWVIFAELFSGSVALFLIFTLAISLLSFSAVSMR